MSELINLGCKVNQYDGYALKSLYGARPDVIIVNTCCVTKEAEIKSLRKYRRALRMNPGSEIIVAGCACVHAPGRYRDAGRLISNRERLKIIHEIEPEPEKARYFLKIQDGCNGKCTYCIVPQVRDQVVSKPIMDIIGEIERAGAKGYREIVLVGANVGLYGSAGEGDLISLCNALSRVAVLPRIRLSSIEPRFINAGLLDALRTLPLCHHFHIPVQSADNHILSRMGRGYSRADLEQKIKLIKDRFHQAAIGADIIVGFPGEDDQKFQSTLEFIDENDFTHLHVFPYSPRPGTAAFGFGDPVTKSRKKQRLHILYDLIKMKQYRFRERMVGSVMETVVDRSGAVSSGLTGNYLPVQLDKKIRVGTLCKVRIESNGETLRGKVLADVNLLK